MNDLVPALSALVETAGLNPDKLFVALEVDDHRNIRVLDRHSVPVTDGEKMTGWSVPSLAGLFRGSRTPPPDMDHYPEEYAPPFFFIENHVLTVCKAKGDRTDQNWKRSTPCSAAARTGAAWAPSTIFSGK